MSLFLLISHTKHNHNATLVELVLYFHLTVFPVFIYPTCELASLKLGSKSSTSVQSQKKDELVHICFDFYMEVRQKIYFY